MDDYKLDLMTKLPDKHSDIMSFIFDKICDGMSFRNAYKQFTGEKTASRPYLMRLCGTPGISEIYAACKACRADVMLDQILDDTKAALDFGETKISGLLKIHIDAKKWVAGRVLDNVVTVKTDDFHTLIAAARERVQKANRVENAETSH